MEKILISSCLLGARVRYHGGAALCDHPLMRKWAAEGRLVPVCPEVAGGLATPRPPAEIVHAGLRHGQHETEIRVRTEGGEDVSAAFEAGAQVALTTARRHDIKLAILKDVSPSCGSSTIYDGTFSGKRTEGRGVTTSLLQANAIRVYDTDQLEAAEAWLEHLEADGPAGMGEG